MLIPPILRAAFAALMFAPLTAVAASAYTAALTVTDLSPPAGGIDKATLQLANTGSTPAGSALALQPCSAATAVWTTPGKSFTY